MRIDRRAKVLVPGDSSCFSAFKTATAFPSRENPYLYKYVVASDRWRMSIRVIVTVLKATVAMLAGKSFSLFQSPVVSFGPSWCAYTTHGCFYYVTFPEENNTAVRVRKFVIIVSVILSGLLSTLSLHYVQYDISCSETQAHLSKSLCEWAKQK